MRNLLKLTLVAVLVAAASGSAFAQGSQKKMMKPPFGSPADVAYAKKLWDQLATARMVGPNSIATTTYEGGTKPHTETLVTLQGKVTVNGNTGLAIVKKNFGKGPKAATEEQVFKEPGKHLRVLTVMYQREKGFDAANQDWFWVIYMPNGQVRKAPNGMQLAGKIAKGMTMAQMPVNCVACHKTADGDDYIFLHDAVAKR